ncbi:MAG: hypothetical protein RL653_2884 [Pseudomonadota bacterium]
MKPSYVLAVLLVSASALAQDAGGGLWGFPTNPVKGGWARYVLDSQAGPRTLVVRCKGASRDPRGRAGQRYDLEFELPDAVRVTLRLWLTGKTASPENVLHMDVVGPDGKVKAMEEDREEAQEKGPQPVPRALGPVRVPVGNASVDAQQWAFPDGTRVGWSGKVPGLGLVYVVGESRLALVATGVGGDPWKGAEQTAFWPEGFPPSR